MQNKNKDAHCKALETTPCLHLSPGSYEVWSMHLLDTEVRVCACSLQIATRVRVRLALDSCWKICLGRSCCACLSQSSRGSATTREALKERCVLEDDLCFVNNEPSLRARARVFNLLSERTSAHECGDFWQSLRRSHVALVYW